MKLCRKENYQGLCEIVEMAQRIVDACIEANDDEAWKCAHDLFTQECGIIEAVRECIGIIDYDWYGGENKDFVLCIFNTIKNEFDNVKVY